jgi:RHS repeat-associated protein
MFRVGTGEVEVLPSDPVGDQQAGAWGIDANGTVVGAQLVSEANGTWEAVRYSDSRGTEVLNDLLRAALPAAATGWNLTKASYIRSADGTQLGEILGDGTHNGVPRSYRMKVTASGDVVSIDDLGISPQYAADAPNVVSASRENGAGEIVGAVYDPWADGPVDAFVYTDATGMIDLTSLTDPNSGWHLILASGINDNHEVVGYGSLNGVIRAFKLTLPDLSPCPPPADSCHTPGQRNLLTGACSNPPVTDGSGCGGITVSVLGVAQEGSTWKAIFDYQSTSPTAVTIPYGADNGLVGADGNTIPSPPQYPPETFVPTPHAPFVATMSGSQLTWTVGTSRAVAIADPQQALPVTTQPDGTHTVTLAGVGTVTIDMAPSVTPELLGIAQNSAGITEAVFTYSTNAPSPVHIPYGQANGLFDDSGSLIPSPPVLPPQWFKSAPPSAFVTPILGQSTTWTIDDISAKATLQSSPLTVTVQPDGTRTVQAPGVGTVNLDVGSIASLLANTIVSSDTSYTAIDQVVDAELSSQQQTPNGPTSDGTLPGQFRVTDDGAAEYTIPIQTPPGRNGVEPHLSLVYNSRAGDGILGPGWTLQGLHKIARCRHPYSIAHERGEDPAPITFTDSDDFCFDGERLTPFGSDYRTKRDQGSRFVVSSRDSLGPVSFQVFRKDGLIETYGGDDNSTNDLRNQYTAPSIDPGVPAGQLATSPVTPVRQAWELASVADRFGNTMTFAYQVTHQAHGAATPPLVSSISYTASSLHPAKKTVSFQYDSSPQLPTGTGTPAPAVIDHWVSGVDTAQALHKLTHIVVSAPNPVAVSNVTEYKLYYDNPSITGRNLLTRITQCGADGVCLQPTTLKWEAGSYDFREVTTNVDDFHCATCSISAAVAPIEGGSRFMVTADVNRDGHDDLLYRQYLPLPSDVDQATQVVLGSKVMLRLGGANDFGPPIATSLPNNWPPVLFDIDGDGAPDVATISNTTYIGHVSQNTWALFQTDPFGLSFSELPLGLTPAQYGDPTFNPEAGPPQMYGSIAPADLDGDGLLDVARSEEVAAGNNILGIRPNFNGVLTQQYFNVVRNGNLIQWGANLADQNVSSGESFAADIDGDGRTELVMSDNTGTPFAVHSGEAGFSIMPTNMTFGCPSRLMDVNGDGLLDVVRSSDPVDGCYSNYQTEINTGRGFYTAAQNLSRAVANLVPLGDASTNPMDQVVGFVADLNGDGMDDVMVPGCAASAAGAPSATAYISTGNGRFTPVPLNIPAGLGLTSLFPAGGGVQVCPSMLMDVDGDGQKDLVQPEPGSDVLHIYFRQGKRPDRLTGVTNGLDATTSIEYGRFDATRGDVACKYPFDCSGSARNIETVSGFTVDNGTGTDGNSSNVSGESQRTHYSMSYGGARGDRIGNGLLGFQSVQRTDDRTGATYERDFDFDTSIGLWYPYQGLPKTETFQVTLSGSGRTLTRTRQTTYTATESNFEDLRGPYIVVPTDIDEIETERAPGQSVNGLTPQRHVHQTFGYGGEGNVTRHETADSVSGTDEIVTYVTSDDYTNWLLNEITQISTKSTSASGETDTRTTNYAIDPSTGAVMGETLEKGDATEQLAVTYSRNPEGLIYKVTETPAVGLTRESRIDYDSIDGTLPATITNALGQATQVAFHPGLGVVGAVQDPNGAITSWQYDGFGRQRGRFDANGMQWTCHYTRQDENFGSMISWLTSTGREGDTFYDDLGRETDRLETAFGGSRQLRMTTRYDVNSGRPGLVSRPWGAFDGTSQYALGNITYDEVGRPTAIQPPNESTRTVTYQGLTSTEFLAGIERGYRVEDGASRVLKSVSIDPNSPSPNGEITTTYDFGPFGNLRHVYQPAGGTVTLSYDHLGHRTEIVDPDAGDRVTGFDSFGDVISEQFPGQTLVTYTPDALGRVALIQQDADDTTYTWDVAANGIGKLASSLSPSNVSIAYAYQPNGSIQASNWTIGASQFSFGWGYDGSGRLQTITYPQIGATSPLAVILGYGGDGRVSSLSLASDGSTVWQKTAVADDGQTSLESFVAAGVSSSHDIDPMTGRLTHISAGTGSIVSAQDGGRTFQNPIQNLGYSYYPDGTVQTRSDFVLGASEGFQYDNLDRLKIWTLSGEQATVQYGYDDSGNLRQRQQTDPSGVNTETYVYGERGAGPHAVTTGPDGSYGYDPSGRQVSRPRQPVLSYTFFDLPTQISDDSSGAVSFSYDADGLRTEKTTAATDVMSAGLYERRTQNGTVTHVFYLPGDGTVIGQIDCDDSGACNSPLFFHPDNVGTLDTVEINGTVAGTEKRDPFGRHYTMSAGASDPANVTLGFNGDEEDVEIGLTNLNHRLYDSRLGRFISPDPLVKNVLDGQAFNRYTFAENNPLSFIDPTGLQSMPTDPGPGPGGIEPLSPGAPLTPEEAAASQGDGVPTLPPFNDGPSDPSALGAFSVSDSAGSMSPAPTVTMPASQSASFVNGNTSGLPLPPGANPTFGYQASAIGVVVDLLENGETRVLRKIFSKAEAVAVRKSGGNVVMKTQQMAHEVETAAADGGKIMRHTGHPLKNGETGFKHYQTEGREGHSAWSGQKGGNFGSLLSLFVPYSWLYDIIEGSLGSDDQPYPGEFAGPPRDTPPGPVGEYSDPDRCQNMSCY